MRAQIKRSMWAMLTTFMMLGAAVSSSAYATTSGGSGSVSDTGSNGQKYTICHRSTSVTNPYVTESVNLSAIDGIGGSDHYGQHQGPLASSQAVAQALKDDHQKWGDIIPPTPINPAGLNWTEVGQAMLANDCNYAKVATASVTKLPATCELGEKLVYGAITGATYSGAADGTTGPASYSVTATAYAGYLFNNTTNTLIFSGTLAGPDKDLCPPAPELKIATAKVNKLPATCTTGEQLSFSDVKYATASGTADGTTGPADFDVTFTADKGAQFDDKGTTVLEFKGSLAGPKTDASCNGGGGSTEVPTTPATPVTPTTQGAAQSVVALPNTAGDASTAVIAGGSLLTTLLGLAGVRRLFGRAL